MAEVEASTRPAAMRILMTTLPWGRTAKIARSLRHRMGEARRTFERHHRDVPARSVRPAPPALGFFSQAPVKYWKNTGARVRSTLRHLPDVGSGSPQRKRPARGAPGATARD